MPQTWVDAPQIVNFDPEDDARSAYHVYPDDDMDIYEPHETRFVLDARKGEDECFDIADWPGYDAKKSLKDNLLAAYEAGDISFESGEGEVSWE